MRVLITGAAAFLGSHLSDRFIAEGHTVIGMDNLITGNMDNIAHLFGHDRFSFVKHNVSQYIYVDGPLDAVLHFASPASPTTRWAWPNTRAHATCWRRRLKSMAIRRSIRSRSRTGGTSTRLVRGGSMTRRSVSLRQ